MRLLAVATISIALSACGGGGSGSSAGTQASVFGSQTASLASCPLEPSQACTREYDPVCAVDSSGYLVTFATACTACARNDVSAYIPGACAAEEMKACQDPRPQVCTLEYDPACGQLSDGTTQTFGSACMACGDTSTMGYYQGECS